MASNSSPEPEQNAYDAIIVAVAHDEYRKLGSTGIHALRARSACAVRSEICVAVRGIGFEALNGSERFRAFGEAERELRHRVERGRAREFGGRAARTRRRICECWIAAALVGARRACSCPARWSRRSGRCSTTPGIPTPRRVAGHARRLRRQRRVGDARLLHAEARHQFSDVARGRRRVSDLQRQFRAGAGACWPCSAGASIRRRCSSATRWRWLG